VGAPVGYLRKARQFVLVFEGEDMAGLEIRATSTSTGNLLDLMDMVDMDRKNLREQGERLRDLFGRFMSNVREWNLEHEGPEGEPVPTPLTVEGLLMHDPDFVLDVSMAWMDGVMGTPGPLAPTSDDGRPSAEALIPMDDL
jgi:hypothetical protein